MPGLNPSTRYNVFALDGELRHAQWVLPSPVDPLDHDHVETGTVPDVAQDPLFFRFVPNEHKSRLALKACRANLPKSVIDEDDD